MSLLSSARLLVLAAASVALVSCQNGSSSSSSSASDPYVTNYPADGGYNPYPGQPGHVSGTSSAPTYETPVAPAEADPYAFHAPSSTPPRSSSSATTSSSSKPRTTVTTSSKPKSSTPSKSKSTAKKSTTGSSTHTVAKGDTLYGIAIKNKTTVAKIKAANNLTSDLIRPGQKLKLR